VDLDFKLQIDEEAIAAPATPRPRAELDVRNVDCMELMRGFPDAHFDLAIVDPPYRNAEDNAPTKQMRANAKGGQMKDFGRKPDAEYFRELRRVSRNQIVWGANNFLEFLPSTNCVIFWFKHNPCDNYSDGELAWTSFPGVTRCFDFRYWGAINADRIKIHPTQKPVALYTWLLDEFAKPGQRVLDTHLGSGSIAIACHYFGAHLTAAELDPHYYGEAMARIRSETAQVALFE
jgi:site-specific DNA-methyltransferase (adenine-specific)